MSGRWPCRRRDLTGKQAGYDNVITLDVGGTSADIGLAQEGRLRMKHLLTRRSAVPGDDPDGRRGHDRRGRRLDRYVDPAASSESPRSAGAAPGPAAYGRGAPSRRRRPLVNLGWLLPRRPRR